MKTVLKESNLYEAKKKNCIFTVALFFKKKTCQPVSFQWNYKAQHAMTPAVVVLQWLDCNIETGRRKSPFLSSSNIRNVVDISCVKKQEVSLQILISMLP